MIAIGNGEPCPFCKSNKHTKIFINSKDNDFIKHMAVKHPKQLGEFLFGSKNIGM